MLLLSQRTFAPHSSCAQQLTDPDSGLAHGELQITSNLMKALYDLGCTGKAGSCFSGAATKAT